MSEWRDIKTAPKDGTEILLIGTAHNMLYPKPTRLVGLYKKGWWWVVGGQFTISHVTHWMPLPEPPK